LNQHIYQRRPVQNSAIPNVIFIILIINGLMFALQQMPQLDQPIFFNFALWPIASTFPGFMPWQLLTYGFLHGDLMHIVFNMFMLWMFGRELEVVFGARRFLVYYLTCVVGTPTTTEAVNAAFRKAAAGPLKGFLAVSDEPLVSSDYIGDPFSSTVDAGSTNVVDGTLVHVSSWYDNEMGYSARCIDLMQYLAERGL